MHLYLRINKRYAIRLWRTKQERYNRRVFYLADWEFELLKQAEHFRLVRWSW